VERCLAGRFKGRLDEARQAMAELAASSEPAELNRRGFRLHERFRPSVPAGERGWGAAGEFDLGKVRALRRWASRRAALVPGLAGGIGRSWRRWPAGDRPSLGRSSPRVSLPPRQVE
jgi:hypothetical protein